MSTSRVTDFAERVKKFYYYRAFLCEQLIMRQVKIDATPPDMPPDTYNPLRSFYIDSHVLACATLDGLSSIWKTLENPSGLASGNTARFINFLLQLNADPDLARVGTPFLYYFLNKQGIEEPFRGRLLWNEQTQEGWVDLVDLYSSHEVYKDPTVSELKAIYQECHRQNPIAANQTIRNIDNTLFQFTYAGLIYKFYRNSFIHEFRTSRYVTSFSDPDEGIAVRQFSGLTVSTQLPSGEIVFTEREFIDGVTPQLDVAIGVLTECIRLGADQAYSLIERERVIDIPDAPDSEIIIKTQ